MEKGRLLYQMPIEIFKKNRRRDLIEQYIGIPVYIICICLAIIGIIHNEWGVTLLAAFGGIGGFYFIFSRMGEMSQGKLWRFEIYENGFIPAEKPLSYIIRREEYFINFNDIKEIEYRRWGSQCNLILKNGKLAWVSVDWCDIDGYIKFSEIIKQYFPNAKYPNSDIVKECFYAWQGWLKKKISEKEYDKIIEKKKEINKGIGL